MYKGVREGRERGGFLPRLKGVGRTGKALVLVLAAMRKTLDLRVEDSPAREIEEMNNLVAEFTQEVDNY